MLFNFVTGHTLIKKFSNNVLLSNITNLLLSNITNFSFFDITYFLIKW